jgi:hypothetical protein
MRALQPFAILLLSGALIAPACTQADNTVGSTLAFSTGATITLPIASATPVSERKPPPNGVVSARTFLLDETTILAVNELALGGQSCEEAVAAEWAQMQKNVASTDPNMKALVRINKAERQKVGASAALHTEIDTRNPREVQEGLPYHAGAGYLLCQRDTYVNLTLSLKGATLEPGKRERLLAIAKSLRARAR